MFRRYWIIILAFGLVASGEALAQDTVPPSTDSPSVEQSSNGQAQKEDTAADRLPFPIRIVEDSEEAERTKRRENDAAQRERDDLSAQQSMAESTQEMVIVSWFQLGLAIAGTVLVFGSLFAAFRANWISRDTARRQLRAYIGVRPNGIVQTRDKKTEFIGHVEFENVGSALATDVRTRVVMDVGAEEREVFDQPEATVSLGAIAPRNKVIQGSEPIGVPEDTEFLFVYGTVNYIDGFKKERWVRFCHRYIFALKDVRKDGRVHISPSIGRQHTAGNNAT